MHNLKFMRCISGLCLLLGLNLPSFAADCDKLPPSSVSVKRLEEPLLLNLNYSYKALKGMSADYSRHNTQVLGLTRGQSTTSVKTSSKVQTDASGRWECASHQINLEYGFSPMTVYVGKEFPKGTCAYNEIYEHEMKHVRTYQEHAKKIEQEINETLRQRFETNTPSRGARGETQQRLQAEINERWMPYIKRLLDQANAEQRLVDSPEEYERVASSCDNAIKKLLTVTR